jgi:hypothetical protein
MSTNEPQTLRNQYSLATKILDAENKQSSAILNDIIKPWQNLHVEQQQISLMKH